MDNGGFRSHSLRGYAQEASEVMEMLVKKHTAAEAVAILESATATYNRNWFTELFWQDFQLMFRAGNEIALKVKVQQDDS